MLTEEHLQQLVVKQCVKNDVSVLPNWKLGHKPQSICCRWLQKKGLRKGKISDYLPALSVYYSEQCLVF
ncbi:hypothetical protein AB3S75_035764 [Citrus x aurantiifolia]